MYLVRRAELPAGEFQWKKKREYPTSEDSNIGMYFNKMKNILKSLNVITSKIIDYNHSNLFKILIDSTIGYYENRI